MHLLLLWLWHSRWYGNRLLDDLLCSFHLYFRLFFLEPLPCSRLFLFEAFAGSNSLSLSLCPHSPLLLKLLLQTLLIVLYLLDGFLFLHLLLYDPLFLLALTHLNDPLHQLLLLLVDLLLLLLFLSETSLHCLPHQLLFLTLLCLNHLPSDHRTRFPAGIGHWSRLLARRLGSLRGASMKRLTEVLSHGHLQCHLIKLGVALNHELLESDEIVHGCDLVDDLLVQGVLAGLGAGLQELVLRDPQLGHELTQ